MSETATPTKTGRHFVTKHQWREWERHGLGYPTRECQGCSSWEVKTLCGVRGTYFPHYSDEEKGNLSIAMALARLLSEEKDD